MLDRTRTQALLEPASSLTSFLRTPDGVHLAHASYFPQNFEKKTTPFVIFLPGRSEPFIKYKFLFDKILNMGWTVHALDHRGQGFSSRLLPDSMKHHIHSFETYAEDVEWFYHNHISPLHGEVAPVLFGRSMGGAIALLTALRHRLPLAKVVLESPMVKINSGNLPYGPVSLLVRFLNTIGFGSFYLFGRGPLDLKEERNNRTLTSDSEHYNRYVDLLEANPQCQVGGPTFGWVAAALKLYPYFQKNIQKLEAPTLILQAETDTIVDNSAQNQMAQLNPDKIKLVTIPNSLHEIFMESTDVQDRAFGEVMGFLKH